MFCIVLFSLAACNSGTSDEVNNKATTNYGNAGMSGTMNANGMLPVDSSKTLNPNAAGSTAPTDTTQMTVDSTMHP